MQGSSGDRHEERGQDKEKTPKTRPMPPNTAEEFTQWADKQRKAKEGDRGEMPPDPPQDQKEPRDHGSRNREG